MRREEQFMRNPFPPKNLSGMCLTREGKKEIQALSRFWLWGRLHPSLKSFKFLNPNCGCPKARFDLTYEFL